MARVCAFYRMAPSEYRALTLAEVSALCEAMREAGEHG